MAVNVRNAFVAKPMDAGTAFSFLPGAFPLPEDAVTPLAEGILACDHGAVDENGFGVAPARSNAKINMFGGKLFVSTQETYEETISIAFLEDDNINVLETVFGETNVEVTEATDEHGTQKTIYHAADELPLKSWVIQAEYQGKVKRFVIEYARVSEVAESRSVHNDATKWELTLDVMEGQNGKYVNEYRDDGVVVAEDEAPENP